MDEFARYLLALHLAFAMPDAPPSIFTSPGVPSPSAPGAVHASPSPSPATPAVIHAPPLAGVGTNSITVTGELGGAVFEELLYAAEKTWTSTGVAEDINMASSCFQFGASWVLYHVSGDAWTSDEPVASPDLVETWTPAFPATGTPIITLNTGLIVPPEIHSPPGHTPGTPGAIHSAPARTPGNPPVITP